MRFQSLIFGKSKSMIRWRKGGRIMSRINNRDYIYLIWKDHKNRQRYIVGELSKNGKYQFN